ncbi:MAG: C39 family peptidase [Chloroflexi bacterium]|nr:C39 family peptidase [Chloroflexota bacterium]
MHVPHLEQERDYSCLAACVRMVLAFYGSVHIEAELRALFKTRPGGTSPAQVMWRLPELGFDAYVETGSQPMLRKHLAAGQPLIVHVWTQPLPYWQQEAIHALVLVELTQESVLAHDPVLPTGPTMIPLDSFLRAWAATDYLTIVIQPKPSA